MDHRSRRLQHALIMPESVAGVGHRSRRSANYCGPHNAWIPNTAGDALPLTVKLHLLELKLTGRLSEVNQVMIDWLDANPGQGSVTMLRSDGTQAPGSPSAA